MLTHASPVVSKIVALAAQLPPEWLAQLAATLQTMATADWARRESLLLQSVPQAAPRLPVKALLDEWRTTAPETSPASIAVALLVAAESAQTQRHAQSLELVWTGPNRTAVPMRRTDQALLQVIHAAQKRLWVVSFAVYKVEAIMTALTQTLQRGVQVGFCVETPEASEGKITVDALRMFAPEVLSRAEVYIWPLAQRMVSPTGQHGSLHAKVAVADGAHLLISSANLTDYAMTLNLEMGVLIHGGALPLQVDSYFAGLLANKVLRRL